MKKLIFFILIFINAFVYSQKDTISNPYTADFDLFIEYLEQTHPDPYTSFGGKMNFRYKVQAIRSEIEEVTDIEPFRNVLADFIAELEDGHTFINSPNTTGNQQPNAYFPVVFKVATNGLFIEYTSREYLQHIGSRLLAINGMSLEELLQKARTLEGVENLYGAMQNVRSLIASRRNAERLLGPFSIVELTLQNTGDEVYSLTVNYDPRPDWVPAKSEIEITKDNNLLYSEILEKENIAYLAWNSIVSREVVEGAGPDSPWFRNMLDWAYNSMQKKRPEDDEEALKNIPGLYETFFSLLKEMKNRNSKHLVIDLRYNSGGMTPLCMPLLYMLYGDDYLNYQCKAQYNRLISPLLLKKWNMVSIEEYNESKNTHYRMGDYLFESFFDYDEEQSIEEKRNNLSLITYENGIGREYTEPLQGEPVYRPHIVVLCSPQTFSAAWHFIYFLTEIGETTIVGVPSRQAGNTFMETTPFELPYTGIEGSISNAVQIMYPTDPGKGKILMPDYPMSWEDYNKYRFDRNAELLYAIDLIKHSF